MADWGFDAIALQWHDGDLARRQGCARVAHEINQIAVCPLGNVLSNMCGVFALSRLRGGMLGTACLIGFGCSSPLDSQRTSELVGDKTDTVQGSNLAGLNLAGLNLSGFN